MRSILEGAAAGNPGGFTANVVADDEEEEEDDFPGEEVPVFEEDRFLGPCVESGYVIINKENGVKERTNK